MKDKYLIFKILALIIFIVLAYFLIKTIQFNTLSSDIEYFDVETFPEDKFYGVIDDKYYYLRDNNFIGHDKDNELFNIELKDVNNIIYDKYIYIIHNNGKISMINRYDAKEKKAIDIEKKVEFSRFEDNKLFLFTFDSIIIKNTKLKDIITFENLSNPVDIDYKANIASIIEMKLKDGIVTSKISIQGIEDGFNLQTNSELFINTFIMQNSIYFVSNRYIYKVDDNKISKKIVLEEISNIDNDDEKIVVSDNGKLKILDSNLEVIDQKVINMKVKDLSIRKNSIVILGSEYLKVYQNSNMIETPIAGEISYASNNEAYYLIFENRIEKINAY